MSFGEDPLNGAPDRESRRWLFYGMGLSALCALLRPGPLLGIVIPGLALACFIRSIAVAPASGRPMSRRRATRSYVRE
ncbi:MAG: hypothetical protein KC766_05725 [Myxococcales bacterium]|nr:hypothetical protein [Planctomycetota bacterium]MCA9627140.1 hypothetical protein [Myxococcales bacterium]